MLTSWNEDRMILTCQNQDRPTSDGVHSPLPDVPVEKALMDTYADEQILVYKK